MTSDDPPAIATWMLTDSLWQRYHLTEERIIADFAQGLTRNDLLLVADTELPAQGFVWCLPTGMIGAFPYLKRIGVDPAAAGSGLGGVLLQELERRLLAGSQRELFLLVSDFNTGAQRFYQRHGYQEIGCIPDLVLAGVSEILFRKQLAALS